MLSKRIIATSALLLGCGIATIPCEAKSKTTTTTRVESAEPKAVRPECPEPPPPISDAELERIAALKSKLMESEGSRHTELQSLHRQLDLLMTKPTIDRAQALQLQSRINAIHADLANTHLNFELDMYEGMPADAKERMRKHRLFDAAFGPPGGHGHGAGLDGPPPPGFGPSPTCVPPPGFGPPPPFGPPPIGVHPGAHRGGSNPNPGGGPGGAPPAPPAASQQKQLKDLPKMQLT